MRLLVTGGCGFVGSNFIRYVLQHYGPEMITNVDSLQTGRLANVEGVAGSYGERYEFLHADIADEDKIEAVLSTHQFFGIVHCAAESCGAASTASLLDRARLHGVRRFLLVSRAAADGPLATAEEAAMAAHREPGMEVVITRASENFGPFQSAAGFVPGAIVCALYGHSLRLACDGARMRDWLHVEDHCAALFNALLDGQPGSFYQVTSGTELRDIDLAERIFDYLGKGRELIELSPPARIVSAPANGDVRRLQGLPEWKPRHSLEQGLRETIDWYVRNREWLKPLPSR